MTSQSETLLNVEVWFRMDRSSGWEKANIALFAKDERHARLKLARMGIASEAIPAIVNRRLLADDGRVDAQLAYIHSDDVVDVRTGTIEPVKYVTRKRRGFLAVLMGGR